MGNRIGLVLTGGQAHDSAQGEARVQAAIPPRTARG